MVVAKVVLDTSRAEFAYLLETILANLGVELTIIRRHVQGTIGGPTLGALVNMSFNGSRAIRGLVRVVTIIDSTLIKIIDSPSSKRRAT